MNIPLPTDRKKYLANHHPSFFFPLYLPTYLPTYPPLSSFLFFSFLFFSIYQTDRKEVTTTHTHTEKNHITAYITVSGIDRPG